LAVFVPDMLLLADQRAAALFSDPHASAIFVFLRDGSRAGFAAASEGFLHA